MKKHASKWCGELEKQKKINTPIPSDAKRKKSVPSKKQKDSDLEEQLNHAKLVIYSLEKELQDKANSNKILSQEISLLKRLDSTSQNTTVNQHSLPHGLHSGPALPPNTNAACPPPPPPIYPPSAYLPRIEQSLSAQSQYDRELQFTKDRLMAIELEQLKTKVSFIESMAFQMNMNHHMLNSQMVNNPQLYHRYYGNIPNPVYYCGTNQFINPFYPHPQIPMNLHPPSPYFAPTQPCSTLCFTSF